MNVIKLLSDGIASPDFSKPRNIGACAISFGAGLYATVTTFTRIREGSTRPIPDAGLGLPSFPGVPSLPFLLTPSTLAANLDAWGRRGRGALEAYLYPELMAIFAGAFFLALALSFLLREAGASTRGNLAPVAALLAGFGENIGMIVLINAWPAKGFGGYLMAFISAAHTAKMLAVISTIVLFVMAFVGGLPGVLREMGLQGAEATRPTAALSQGKQAAPAAGAATPEGGKRRAKRAT